MERTDNTLNTQNNGINAKPAYGMKWHYFLIWFVLFFLAILSIVDGFGCMEYAGIIDGAVFFGLFEIVQGAFLIFVRFQLSGFKKNAVNYFTAAQVANIVISLLSILALGMEFDVTSIIGNIVAIMVIRNYYGKRSELFVN